MCEATHDFDFTIDAALKRLTTRTAMPYVVNNPTKGNPVLALEECGEKPNDQYYGNIALPERCTNVSLKRPCVSLTIMPDTKQPKANVFL